MNFISIFPISFLGLGGWFMVDSAVVEGVSLVSALLWVVGGFLVGFLVGSLFAWLIDRC